MSRALLLVLIQILFFSTAFTQKLIPIQKDDKWGYCNEQMEIILPPQYDQAYPFYENRALVEFFNYDDDKNEHKACFINPEGKAIFCWDVFAQGFPASRFQNGISLIENYQYENYQASSTLSIVDTNGYSLRTIEHAALDFDLSMYHQYGAPFDETGIYCSNWTTEDSMGTVLIYQNSLSPQYLPYQSVTNFKDGIAIAYLQPLPHEDGYPTALIDSAGNILIPGGKYRMIPDYECNTYGSNGLITVEQEGKYGFINRSGELIIPYRFDNARSFSEDMAAVGKIVDKDEYGSPIYRWGYIDHSAELIIEYQYDEAFRFSEGLAEVTKANRIQFINPKGEVQFEFKQKIKKSEFDIPYTYGSYVYNHGFKDGRAIVYQDDQIGWIDKKGNFIIPPYFKGLGRIGPSTLVMDFDEQALNKVSHPDGAEIYINQNGKQYYLPQPVILPKKEGSIPTYSNIQPPKFTDSLSTYALANFVQLKEKGEWIEIKHYNPDCKYVRATDYYYKILICTQEAKLYKNANKEEVASLTLAPNSRLYLADSEKDRKVKRKNKWLKVIYWGEKAGTYEWEKQEFYILSDQVDWLVR